ncbi:hypothetical protein F2Q68_00030941 [Brassica cretica]|uniref:Ubiquitin-like protease family profile domain-containing protein n=2 Tax=Brassica cretica TaxID=69181 RepID=A0A8S9G8M3_BRACR|nr:hypothetical protein F2Q68_00030941 [Brassica cretica]
MDIDDIYAPVNFADSHWIAMWISIPKRHIVVFDSICSSISPEELDVVMEPFLYMVPYLLVECASSDELRAQYSLEPFTYERPTNIPPARAGDCGVYTLKYIECHALGIEFSKKDFAKANGKSMRDKMAVDIFQELPDAHEFENKDMDDILEDLQLSRLDDLTISSLESLLSSDLLKSLAEDKGPDVPADVPAAVPADASSSEDKAPEPSLVLLDKNQSTVSDLQKEDARYLEKRDAALARCRAKSYNPFAPIEKNKLKELADWLKSCPYYRTALDKKPRKSRTWWYSILRTSLEWLEDCHIDAWINVMRKRFNFKDFKDSKPNQNGLGRRLPGGAWNYYAGTIPSFCQSNKVWGMDIDDIYAPVNFADSHWIAMWISIPKRHIVVFDSICSSISPEELDVVMKPFLYMVPYLLVECASSDELRAQYSLEPFTYERPTNIPPARAGDCGVYTLKYIECHALGIEFSKKDFAKANGKSMRDKMAVDIFQELPDAHEFENKDMDDILGTYDG